MNIQQRRENRKATWSLNGRSIEEETVGTMTSFYTSAGLKVNEALERGQKEIDCVKMFAAVTKPPEKLMNNFFIAMYGPVNAEKTPPHSTRRPGQPFGHKCGV